MSPLKIWRSLVFCTGNWMLTNMRTIQSLKLSEKSEDTATRWGSVNSYNRQEFPSTKVLRDEVEKINWIAVLALIANDSSACMNEVIWHCSVWLLMLSVLFLTYLVKQSETRLVYWPYTRCRMWSQSPLRSYRDMSRRSRASLKSICIQMRKSDTFLKEVVSPLPHQDKTAGHQSPSQLSHIYNISLAKPHNASVLRTSNDKMSRHNPLRQNGGAYRLHSCFYYS